jgi:hypothetical protein
MKVLALVTVLFAAFTSVSAQAPFGRLPSPCGPKDASFSVRLDKSQHSLTQPEPGKARIYFIDESGGSNPFQPAILGIDGAWVGAIHRNSYFSVSVDPGDHHMCAASPSYRETKAVVLAHLQAEAGKTYFFRTGSIVWGLKLDPVDSDEGKLLIASYPLSVSRPKN